MERALLDATAINPYTSGVMVAMEQKSCQVISQMIQHMLQLIRNLYYFLRKFVDSSSYNYRPPTFPWVEILFYRLIQIPPAYLRYLNSSTLCL